METASFTLLGAHAKGRGDGDAAVRVCDVNSRREELRCSPQRPPHDPPSDR